METPGDCRTTRTDSTLMNMHHNSFSRTLKVPDYQIRVQIPFIFPRMKIRLQFTVCIMKHALGRIYLIWAERLFPSFGVVPYQTLSFYPYILICAENAHNSKIKSNAQLASRKRRKSFQLLVIIWTLLNLKGNYTMIQFQILRRNSKRLYHQWIAHRLFLLVLLRQHYTFDFAQPVCLPHFVVQPSQLYFKNLMQVQVYGISCDSAGVQCNYLFDEESTIGIDGTTCHGPDTVISLLHYHLSKYSLGEKGVVFHADNCYGQNKNKTVLHYMMWRIANGLNENITVNFMEPGHTKCRCDQLFGISKKLVKKSDVNNIYELGDIIQRSSKFNKTIQVRDSDGNQQVPWRNWSAMLSQHMRPLPGISKYYVFKMSADTPGKRSCLLCGPTVLYKDGRPWFVWRLMNFQKIKGYSAVWPLWQAAYITVHAQF